MAEVTLRTSTLEGLRPEAELLLALSRLRLTPDEQSRIRAFLAAGGKEFDWGFFLDQACRHMVLQLVGRNLSRLRLTHDDDGRPLVPYHWIYSDVYEGSRSRNLALADEYSRVFRALNEAGLDYAVRKGPVLGEGVYRDAAARRMADLDVLMRRADFPVFEEVATQLGYTMGRLSGNGQRVLPFDRRTQLYWKVNLTNISLPYLRIGSVGDVEAYILSGCFSLFQPMDGVTADAPELLARSVPTMLYGEPARMLDPVDQIIDACVQIHVESTMLYYIESGKDLTIRKFLDLVEILRLAPPGYREELISRASHYDCGASMYYALHYAARLYPDSVPRDLAVPFTPADPAYLDEYGGYDGERFRWEHGFADRMFDQRRSAAVAARSAVPGPRSGI